MEINLTVSAPPTNQGRKFPPEVLTTEQARALLFAPSSRAPTGLRNRALMAVMYGAGLRLAEALALKPSDIDYDKNDVHVLCGKGKKDRTAGIDDAALGLVVRWLDRRKSLGIKGRILLCRLDGGPLDPRYVRAMMQRSAERAGIDKRVHPHGLRHTHAVELERDGLTVSEIQDQLGHGSLNTTSVYLKHMAPSRRIEKIKHRRTEF